MKTEIGKMDSKDWMVVGGITLVSLTGVFLLAMQIKKLGDRKKLLTAQLNEKPHTKEKSANASGSDAPDTVRTDKKHWNGLYWEFNGNEVNCFGCDGSQNCSGCPKYSNVAGGKGGYKNLSKTDCDSNGGWWWNGKCHNPIN